MRDLQHIAYKISEEAWEQAKQRAVAKYLSKVDSYDSADPDDVRSATMCIDQAFDLCHQASSIARQMSQSHKRDKAIAELTRRCPGYSIETYRQAIEHAFERLKL